ncbi:hypothetical protein KAJ27_04045 [bacterium]|nr:hypothetical protein [bacterium]
MKKMLVIAGVLILMSQCLFCQTAAEIVDKLIEGNDYISNIVGKVNVERSIDKPGVAKLFNFLRKKKDDYYFYVADGKVDKNSKVSESIKGDAIYMVHKASGSNPTWLSYVDSDKNKVSNWFYYKLGNEHLIPVSTESKVDELGLDPLKIKKANKDRFNYKMVKRGVGQYVIEITPKHPESEQFVKLNAYVKEVTAQYPTRSEKFYYLVGLKGLGEGAKSSSNWEFNDFIFAPISKGNTIYKEDFKSEEEMVTEEGITLKEGEYLMVIPTKINSTADLKLNGKKYTTNVKVKLDRENLAYNYSESEVESMFGGKYQLLNKYLEKIRAHHHQR